MNKRVASIVLNSFTNDSRVYKEAVSLIRIGYHVEVVALHESNLPVNETIQQVSVHRMQLKTHHLPRKPFFQAFKYAEFIFKTISQYKNFEIIHCHDLETLPIGVWIKLFFNKQAKVVYDAHEHETERSYKQNRWLKKFKRNMEQYFIRHADAVITVSESIAADYMKLYKIHKPYLVYNCPHYYPPSNQNLFRKTFHIPEETKVFLYQGALGYGRGIEIMIDAFKKMPDHVIVFMGYGVMKNQIKKASEEHTNIFYHQAVDQDKLHDFTSSADWGLVYIENVSLSYNYCLPNKLFEFIFAGLPIIVTPLSELTNFVKTYPVGIISEGFTSDDLIKAVKQTQTFNKENFNSHFREIVEKFNWEEQEKVLADIYNAL
jgi:glycosyltransferase involved in cell wall biosynthesis